jgi:hypothetical protein
MKVNLIQTLLNFLTGSDLQEATLLEIRSRAGGITPGSISRLERISDSELVVHYQAGRLMGSSRIRSTRQTLNHYESVLLSVYPRISLRKGSSVAAAKRQFSEIQLDTNFN